LHLLESLYVDNGIVLALVDLALVDDTAGVGTVAQHAVDGGAVDLAVVDVLHQPLQRWAVHVATGEAAVVIAGRQHLPALVGLGLYEDIAGVPLRLQRVEVHVQVLARGLARV
jgi:hypothetical protein